jgi:hypothetical protein
MRPSRAFTGVIANRLRRLQKLTHFSRRPTKTNWPTWPTWPTWPSRNNQAFFVSLTVHVGFDRVARRFAARRISSVLAAAADAFGRRYAARRLLAVHGFHRFRCNPYNRLSRYTAMTLHFRERRGRRIRRSPKLNSHCVRTAQPPGRLDFVRERCN